ncbi:MAG: hypothetical protein JSU69_06370 [Candidatus Zixiibacteriota bacterium]|nr:MAG: hypothetical protein JSU69_06370 [candidate division Zixibacteria bacterium]
MKRDLGILTAFMIGIMLIGGCGPADIEGPERTNMPPVVDFVNIPVEEAKFSADTTLYWYGTDVDGFITHFRYAVIEADTVGDPVLFIETTPDTEYPWVVLEVELNNPQTNHKVKMSADVSDPVRKYVASYVFLQAIDNLGAKSAIVYRMFYKNNHFPNTLISLQNLTDPYVNTISMTGILEGVTISWNGEDPIDYPRNPPPFQFQWKFWGPFDSLTSVALDSVCVGSVFVDNYGDRYYDCEDYPANIVIDTTIIEITPDSSDTIINIDTTFVPVCSLSRGNPYGDWHEFLYLDSIANHPEFDRLVEQSEDQITGGPWVYDQNSSIYDVYRNVIVDTTSMYYFLFWCQSRDDSKVPDPTPAFGWVAVIEPKFERDVIVIDACNYKKVQYGFWNWPVYPTSPFPRDIEPTVKEFIAESVRGWGADFDTDNILPNDTFYLPNGGIEDIIPYYTNKATQDYYPIIKLKRDVLSGKGIASVNLRDILKHKIIILVKDNTGGELVMNSPELLAVMDGIDVGMSCWSFVRSPFQGAYYTPYPTFPEVPEEYQAHFGVLRMRHTGWQGNINDTLRPGTRIDDFIGAGVLSEYQDDFPDLPTDCARLESEYYWQPGSGFWSFPFRCWQDGSYMFYRWWDEPDKAALYGDINCAYPEVGYVEKHPLAGAIYLYQSYYGDQPPVLYPWCATLAGHFEKYEGAVVGIRYDTDVFRTAHFSFSLQPIVSDSSQKAFNSMMDWLSEQPFIQTGKLASHRPVKTNKEHLRNISRNLHELKKQGLLRGCDGE